MDKERAIEILKETGVMQEGHFKLTSGRHSDRYMQCAKLFIRPETSAEMSKALAKKFKDLKIDLVIGPAIGGIILAYEVSRQLNVPNIFAERQDGDMTFRRGFSVEPGAKVLVVEDVVTTGGSVKEVIALAVENGAEVVGVGAIVDRSNGTVDFGTRFEAVLSMEVKSYEPEECPICKTGMPITKPGSRVKFK
ncbi:MAG: orotate phosphoribosyltransferase [Eubacteriales bacterium]